MLVAKWGQLPTETSPLSSEIVIRRQKGGPKCNPDTPLRQRLTLYGVSALVPNILEDKLIRSLVQNGKSLAWAYGAVRVSDLIPGSLTLAYCAEKVFKSGGPGPQTCDGFLNCLQSYLEETGRLVVPEAGPLPAEPVPPDELEPIPPPPPEPSLPEIPVMPLPGIRPGPSQEWLDWIEAVAPLARHIPPPQTPLVRADGLPGPPEEWLEWIRAVAPLVPDLPPPEPIPGTELLPGAEAPAEPVRAMLPAIPGARTGLVAVVGGVLAAILLFRSGRGGS